MAVPSIAFVTTNPAKFATANEHLAGTGITLEHVPIELDEIQSDSVEAVALHKATQAFHLLSRPLIIEDSGFYIDDLQGFPGPFVKYVVKSLGPTGVARVADLAATRRCHFVGVLIYVDSRGTPHAFFGTDAKGIVAEEPAAERHSGSWSVLWDIFIPDGCTRPLSSLHDDERAGIFENWAKQSVFAQFGDWLKDHDHRLTELVSVGTV